MVTRWVWMTCFPFLISQSSFVTLLYLYNPAEYKPVWQNQDEKSAYIPGQNQDEKSTYIPRQNQDEKSTLSFGRTKMKKDPAEQIKKKNLLFRGGITLMLSLALSKSLFSPHFTTCGQITTKNISWFHSKLNPLPLPGINHCIIIHFGLKNISPHFLGKFELYIHPSFIIIIGLSSKRISTRSTSLDKV